MKPILFGAALGVLWVLLGLPVTVPSGTLTLVCQPVILAFAAGTAARPYMPLGRWSR